MSQPITYVDTSALAKLFLPEQETAFLREWLDANTTVLATSNLTTTELLRACRKRSPLLVPRAQTVLSGIFRIPLSSDICYSAGVAVPLPLKSLDALHVATALYLGEDVKGILTYDKQMIASARAAGLATFSPGALY